MNNSLTDSSKSHALDDIAQMLQQRETFWLDARAAKSSQSRGRERSENADPYRTEWQRDRDRIVHCKAFRRLKHKTQVFVSPEHDHYRTRLTHTLEVSQIARTVARALRLNEDLTEAISLGHDLGHAPFGHVGEEALDEAYRTFDADARFRHYEQSLRIVDMLEKAGDGLNLTWETRDGILHHSKGKSDLMSAGRTLPSTLEGQVVRICDRVAYVNHDIDDAIRAGLISRDELPRDCIALLGGSHAGRITTMINAIIEASSEICAEVTANIATANVEIENIEMSNVEHSKGANFTNNSNVESIVSKRCVREEIRMTPDVSQATDRLKDWMFSHVYKLESVDETPRVRRVLVALFEKFMDEPNWMRGMNVEGWENWTQPQRARLVCDYIAGMTDRYASQTYAQLFLPSSWRGV